MLGRFRYQIHQFSCTSFCGSVLQLRNVNVKTMIWKYGWMDKSGFCSWPIKYSNPYFNYDGSKLFTPFAIGITVTNSVTIPKNSVRHLVVTLPSIMTTCFQFHSINDATTGTRMHCGDTLMTSSTQGTASSEAFYLITLERGWVMLWLAFWGSFLKLVVLRRRYRQGPYVASKC